MKKMLFLLLFPLIGFGQTQIGNDIDGEAGDQSGLSVSLSSDGTVLAIGSPSNSNNGNISGRVRVYKNVSGNWVQEGLSIDGEEGDVLGSSVALSSDGSILAIGAPNANSYSGEAKVYKNISGIWTQLGSNIIGTSLNEQLGFSVSVSSDGSVLAIGAPSFSGIIGTSGRTLVFKNISGNWVQQGSAIVGEDLSDGAGNKVCLSEDGSILAISAPGSDGNGAESGHVRVYKNVSGNWVQEGVDINGEAAGDLSSVGLALSDDGTIIAIGAHLNNGNGTQSGHVRVYQKIGNNWIQQGQDINGQTAQDFFGFSVALSSDGTILAAAAPHNNATVLGSGYVRVYKKIASNWVQQGLEIDGEDLADECGFSIALSSDGTKLAVGATANNQNGLSAGHTRVYDLTGVLSSDQYVIKNFTIHPNPTFNTLNINLQNNLQFKTANMYTVSGQLIKSETSEKINVNDLSSGTYFIEVITDKGKATKPFIKK